MIKKEELKNIVYISVGITFAIALLYILILKKEICFINVLRGISFGVSIATFFWTFYISYGWKWCLLNLIFYRPNLNGTWTGKLTSDYIDTNGNTINPKDFFIVIRQNFIRIHFTTFTDNFVGISYAETFTLNKDEGLKNIAYMYKKDTTQNIDEQMREGATELRLIISDKNKLEGKFWSNTKTQGTIKVEFISNKQVDSFADAKKIHNG